MTDWMARAQAEFADVGHPPTAKTDETSAFDSFDSATLGPILEVQAVPFGSFVSGG
jgi:hypothetical protein